MTVKYAEDKAVEEDSYLRVVQYCSFVWERERENGMTNTASRTAQTSSTTISEMYFDIPRPGQRST